MESGPSYHQWPLISPLPTFGGRNIEKLKCFNRLLLAVLQGHKGRCESLSMQLGQREAEATALRLALQYRLVHPPVASAAGEGTGCPKMAPLAQEPGPLWEITFPHQRIRAIAVQGVLRETHASRREGRGEK